MNYYDLSSSQNNIWSLQKFYDNSAIANIGGTIFFEKEKNIEILTRAINYVIEKQTALRIQVVEIGGEVKQYVKEYSYRSINVREFSSCSKYENYAKEMTSKPISLYSENMNFFEIIKIDSQVGILAIFSHLVSDAWTFSLIVREIESAYSEIENGSEHNCQNEDYIRHVLDEKDYFYSEKYVKDRNYWKEEYRNGVEKTVIKQGAINAFNIAAGRIVTRISKNLSYEIQEYCRNKGVSEAVFFETVLGIYLYKINSNNSTITLGLPVLNRTKTYEKRIAGMFVSTVPLTFEIKESDKISQVQQNIKEKQIQMFRHQKYPYGLILNAIRKKQELEGNIYDVMFSFQNAKTDVDAITEWYCNGYSEIPFTVHVDNRDNSDTYTVTIDYQKEIFRHEQEVYSILDRLDYVTRQILKQDCKSVKEISIVPEKEKNRIINDFNNTKVDYPRDKCVHELFMEQVKKTPDAIAVVFEEKEITYRELDEMSNVLAHLLREKGVERGSIVPIIASKSWHVIVAMLGILKAGAGYMPVASDFPKERIQFIVNETKSKIACVYGYEDNLDNVDILKLNEIIYKDAKEKGYLLVKENIPEDVCYVIFTSGSTGVPKGIVLSNHTLTNLIHWQNVKGVLTNSKRIISFTSIVFDVFSQEVFSTILNGLTLIIANDEIKHNLVQARKYIEEVGADTLYCTPSYYGAITKEEKINIAKVILAGEAFVVNRNSQEQGIEYYNQYGPAETHVVTCSRVKNFMDVTIGIPISNTQIYILDKDNRVLPIGVPGELCIAGEGVGMGYLNRPEFTKEKFILNPFATKENGHGTVMYRTGDLAAWRENGEIEYLGRMDTQVKIRGLRIELGEIESVMSEFTGVHMCAVTDKRSEDGRQYLVGYYTTISDGRKELDIITAIKVDEKELRKYLLQKLPKYMVPNYFMHLSEIPMTSSGKIDRKNLPDIQSNIIFEEIKLPKNEIEEKILSIWKRELNIYDIGCNQDFFEIGGDSLLAIGILTIIEQELNIRLQMKDFLENSTVEELAKLICTNGDCFKDKNEITKNQTTKFILTPQQKAIYYASQKNKDSLTYNMPAFLEIPITISREKLIKAIQKVYQKFPILRMSVCEEEGKLYGTINKDSQLFIEEYEDAQIEEFTRPFELDKAPLFRIGLSSKYLLLDMHHIISDGSSLQILIKAIKNEYENKFSEDEKVEYGDYANYLEAYLQKEIVKKGLEWYQNNLFSDAEKVVFPKIQKDSLYKGEQYQYRLSEKIKSIEKEICKKYKITETILHFATYGFVLSLYSGKENIAGNIIVTNRQHYEVSNTMGMFVNTLPVTWEFIKKQTVEEYLKICKEKVLCMYEYQEIPSEVIMKNIGKDKSSNFNTAFVYQASGIKNIALDDEEIAIQTLETHSAKFDLTIEVIPDKEGDYLKLEYRTELVNAYLAEHIAQCYENILLQMAEKEYLDEIDVLSSEEYQRIIHQFNDTKVDYPRNKCVHELFMEQVKKTPDAIAVVFEEKEITYQELDEMSNGLAIALKEKGIKKNDLVGVLLERDEKVIIVQIAVLKLGAVFIPIDRRYPEERIQYIIDNCNVSFIIKNQDKLIKYKNTIDIESLEYETCNKIESVKIETEEGCYIIFTSGSTGKPKGCILTNKGLANFCRNNNILETCNRLQKRIAVSVNTISFDFFIAESLLPLVNGYTVVLANEEESVKQELFANLIKKTGANIIQTTPTKYKMLLANKTDIQQFDIFVSSGEALTFELYKMLSTNQRAKIFNPLGPSECSVWAVGGEIFKGNNEAKECDITIGKPIANTQIYILNKNGKPVPIGVPGELCIAGDGVGLGYLNRPELTEEKFVRNPFATDENGHGKIMYHTGDLAAWRENGEIEYLGRIDTQVKIRGLRIELGEIESVMSEFTGIHMCAVADKHSIDGRQYLVGYYSTLSDGRENQEIITAIRIDEKELRKHFLKKLPKYMVPNCFMHLSKIPMTPSGKIDRRNLPEPKWEIGCDEEYIAPRNKVEELLCSTMEQILNYHSIGIKQDFFSCGGDSLKAIEYIVNLEKAGINLKLQEIYDFPTVEELVKCLKEEKPVSFKKYDIDEFKKYKELLQRNTIISDKIPGEIEIKSVLLTGVTGFLGAHVAEELLQNTNCIIYCLVRGKDNEEGEERIKSTFNYYFSNRYLDVIGERIIPINGDITDEKLLEKMSIKVDMVIHTAATVKHFGSYKYFYSVNVLGTKCMVNYAKKVGAKLIHISTISVSGNSLADGFDTEYAQEKRYYAENNLYQEQSLENVYVRSKFEAECIVLDAVLDDLSANIIRVGNLTNRSKDYVFQKNYKENAFLARMKAIMELGSVPEYFLPLYCEFSPVDDTANAIVKIAKHFNMQHTIFHVYSNMNLYFDKMVKILEKLSINMRVLSKKEFKNCLFSTLQQDKSYIYEAFVNDMDGEGNINYETNIYIQNDFTIRYLKQLGFEWTKIDYEYVKGYIEYFKEKGFLKVE